MFKINIKNYQALSDVDIKCEPGITAIVGQSNEGKSAVIRAVRDVVFNKCTDKKIRSGERYVNVTLSNDSNSVSFQRDGVGKSDKTTYIVNGGMPLQKVGVNQVPEVNEALNISEIVLSEDKKLRINFWFQGEKPFLTDLTSMALYSFFSVSSCEEFLKVLRTLKSDVSGLDKQRNELTGTINTLKTLNNEKQIYLDKTKGFEDVYSKSVSLKRNIEMLTKLKSLMDELDRLISLRRECDSKLYSVKGVLSKSDVKGLQVEFDNLSVLEGKVSIASGGLLGLSELDKQMGYTKSRLTGVKDILIKSNKEYVSGLVDSVKGMDLRLDSVKNILGRLDSISKDKVKFENRLNYVDGILKLCDSKNVENSLGSVVSLSSSLGNMKDALSQMYKFEQSVVELEEKVRNVDKYISVNSLEFDNFKKYIGMCPLCGNTLVGGECHNG